MNDLLVVFVKAPRPGAVKTRLAARIGAERAAALSRAMAERVLARTRPADAVHARVLFYSPAEAQAEMAAWLPGERLVAQAAGDVGARMSAAFRWAFDEGAHRVVLIGTDVPDLAGGDVGEALRALGASDLVLGPALDGGYYLVGLRRPCPEIFEGVAWSTAAVLGETLARAESAGLRVRPLAARGDVDTVDDLRREWPRLRAWLPPDLARDLAPVIGENGAP